MWRSMEYLSLPTLLLLLSTALEARGNVVNPLQPWEPITVETDAGNVTGRLGGGTPPVLPILAFTSRCRCHNGRMCLHPSGQRRARSTRCEYNPTKSTALTSCC